METIKIETNNTNNIFAQVYNSEFKNILIIASATGVKQNFYKDFAEYLTQKGITVITFDYSGIGKSLNTSIKKNNANATDWGKNDLAAVIKYAKKNYPMDHITILGHSIGGQLIGLSKLSLEVNKIILVASQSGYWKLWDGMDRVKMWFNWYILFPTFLKLLGYLPSKKLTGMENLPKGVANEWSKWGRNPNYLFDYINNENSYYEKILVEITSIRLEDDFFAPKKAVEWLNKKYCNAKLKEINLNANDFNEKQFGHFGIFKKRLENKIWPILLKEIEQI